MERGLESNSVSYSVLVRECKGQVGNGQEVTKKAEVEDPALVGVLIREQRERGRETGVRVRL